MLYETFICVTLPDIYSPIKYNEIIDGNQLHHMNLNGFKIGSYMIREIEIHSGGIFI